MNENYENDLPYIGMAFDLSKMSYWVYFINPSLKIEYSRITSYTGAYLEDIQTTRYFKDWGNLSTESVFLIQKGDVRGLDFTIWYKFDLLTMYGKLALCQFTLPRGWTTSSEKQELLDCGIFGYKIILEPRGGESIEEIVLHDKQNGDSIVKSPQSLSEMRTKQRENRKRYHERMKDDPEYKAKERERWKRWYENKKKTSRN